MGRFDEWLQELCPEGVKFSELQYLAEIGTGSSDRKDSSEDGLYPFYVRSKEILRINKWEYDEEAIIIPGEGGIGEIFHFVNGKYALHQRAYRIHIIDPALSTKFLYYYMSAYFKSFIMQKAVSATVTSIRKPMIEQFKVPIPPIEVQDKIVQELDVFSQRTTELAQEISTELASRKAQYGYYKDKLLPFELDEAEWKPLGDICTIVRGASPRPIKKYITEDTNGVNWIKIGDVAPGAKYITGCAERITPEGAKKSRHVKPGDFILSNSMSFGRPYILQISGCIHDGWLAISDFDDYLSADYLYHVLTSDYIQREMRKKASFGGAVQNLNAEIVRAIEIPLVPRNRQNKIVSVLDRFSEICNSISSELPAEIEARNKQYVYYREKLLSFKEKGKTI